MYKILIALASPAAAANLDAAQKMPIIHDIELLTEPSRRHCDLDDVWEIALDSSWILAALIPG
jgi:hypothetical protein